MFLEALEVPQHVSKQKNASSCLNVSARKRKDANGAMTVVFVQMYSVRLKDVFGTRLTRHVDPSLPGLLRIALGLRRVSVTRPRGVIGTDTTRGACRFSEMLGN